MIISPEKGKVKEIGQRLLALADSPYQVQWVTWPKAGFSIPLELFFKFDTEGDNYVTVGIDAEKLDAALEGAQSATVTQTPKRRRRRSTDNSTSEEE